MPEDIPHQLPRRDFIKLPGPGFCIVAAALIYELQFSYPEDFHARLQGKAGVGYDRVLAGLK